MRNAIDSCVWIAYKSKRDENHENAVKIINKFLDDKSLRFCITDYVIIEVINFLLRKTSKEIAIETLDLFLQHGRIEICIVDKPLFDRSCEITRKFGVSLTDASIATMMENFRIKILYSFDSEFDRIGGGIERVVLP